MRKRNIKKQIWLDIKEDELLKRIDTKKVKIIKINRIKPLSDELVKAVSECEKVFFFEEGVKSGGVGESFASVMLENKLYPEIYLTAFPDCFVKQGKTDSIFRQYKLDCEGMVSTIKENLWATKKDLI